MKIIELTAMTLARSADGNPIITTVVIILFALMFNHFEAMVETLFFGERLQHWLDPVFMLVVIAYSAYTVWACAVFNSAKGASV